MDGEVNPYKQLTPFIIVIGFLNVLLGTATVLTPLIFSVMGKRLFMRIIAMISLCAIFNGISLLFSINRNPTLCQWQGGMALFFFAACLSWTVALSYQLYGVVRTNKPAMSELNMHIIFWGWPLLDLLLPYFVGGSYGNDDDEYLLCLEKPQTSKKISGVIIASVILHLITILAAFYLYVKITFAIDNAPEDKKKQLTEVAGVLKYYSLVIVVLWAPNIVGLLTIELAASLTIKGRIFQYTLLFGNLYGIFIPLIFFITSKEARFRWKKLFLEFKIDNHAQLSIQEFGNVNARDLSIINEREGSIVDASNPYNSQSTDVRITEVERSGSMERVSTTSSFSLNSRTNMNRTSNLIAMIQLEKRKSLQEAAKTTDVDVSIESP